MCELDSVFQALAEERRRLALFCLQQHHTVALADLAELVAEQEYGTSVTAISSEEIRDVYFSLYHNHVPVLEDVDLVHYEQEEDIITLTKQTTSLLASARDKLDTILEGMN